MSNTYSTQWRHPVRTQGQWTDVVTRDPAEDIARQALADKIKARLHCRLVLHTEGRKDEIIAIHGPFTTPPARHDWT